MFHSTLFKYLAFKAEKWTSVLCMKITVCIDVGVLYIHGTDNTVFVYAEVLNSQEVALMIASKGFKGN